MRRVGLRSVGVGCVEMHRVGLRSVGLGWVEMHIGLCCVEMRRVGLRSVGLGCVEMRSVECVEMLLYIYYTTKMNSLGRVLFLTCLSPTSRKFKLLVKAVGKYLLGFLFF